MSASPQQTRERLLAQPQRAGSGVPPLRIGISCHASDRGRSGIGQYLINVVRRLPSLAPHHEFVLFAPRQDATLWTGLGPNVRVVGQPDWLEKPHASLPWHLLGLRGALAAEACDVVFLPCGNRRLGAAYGVPAVATVHDLSQLHVSRKYDRLRMWHARYLLPLLMRRLDRVICVSESTRRDVIGPAAVQPERVTVIHNGADLDRFRQRQPALRSRLARRFGLYGDYILYVSRLEHPGKNHVRLLEAFARLSVREGIHHRLVLCGPDWDGSEAVHAAITRLGLGDRVMTTGFVAAADLPDLYQGASLFVFPSLYEGFGIPLVEAMAAGTPVCAADRSSLPEVAGDAAVLFDPFEPAAMEKAMFELLTDPGLRETYTARGLRRADQFDWDRCALAVLREIEHASRRHVSR
jgi:glycosyltransferase involved in cell wall biosynthesis